MYETLSKFAQTGGLVLFVIAFALVLIYALSPRNKANFDHAKRIPLDEGDE
ncbi:MAG TPA: cbb3-type cytochrome c oxidase subunit 3 [Parvularculaceae bacterium]|nr:cbb3-type cytochrome c oxidase subunit 3 [Parvularculaceae bacterium]